MKQILGGRYELMDQIGTGGMAVVWHAHDAVLGRAVAVKLLAGAAAGDDTARRRIRDEARAAATLSHPHIAQVYDFGESTSDGDPVPYVVMELLLGGTLSQRLAASPMSAIDTFRVCSEVAAALAAAHADGLVHRDIKPANVMMTPTGVKVVDFGIAAAISPGGAGEPAAELLGTPAYLAPERLTGDAVEPASDVYALGVMLYRMLAGRSPWTADTTTKMLEAHIYVDPIPLPLLPGVPDYVTGLVNRCLSKDPRQRPSAREAAAMLAHAAGTRLLRQDPPSTPAPVPPSVSVLSPVSVPSPAAVGMLVPAPRTPPESDPGAAARPPAESSAPQPVAAGASDSGASVGRRVAMGVSAIVIGAGVAALWLVLPHVDFAAAPGPAASGTHPPQGLEPPGLNPQPGTNPQPSVGAQAGGSGPRPVETTGDTPTLPRSSGRAVPPLGQSGQAEPASGERTMSSVGGVVRATCMSDGVVEILSYRATKPYEVDGANLGPSSTPTIDFRHGNRRVSMTITCGNGVPSAYTFTE